MRQWDSIKQWGKKYLSWEFFLSRTTATSNANIYIKPLQFIYFLLFNKPNSEKVQISTEIDIYKHVLKSFWELMQTSAQNIGLNC